MKPIFRIMTVGCMLMTASCLYAAPKNKILKVTDKEFFITEEARRIGDQLLLYQRVTGGWPKNIDMVRPVNAQEIDSLMVEKQRRDDSTIDNNATVMQLSYLARLYQATADAKYKQSFADGIEYLLSGQYDNGGWPQFWPGPTGYQVHITFNDYAMTNTLNLFRDIIGGEYPYDNTLVDTKTVERLKTSFDKGIECILATQIVVEGKPTVWCQQHDRDTYAPAGARAYELPSFCSQESAEIVRLLMSSPSPDSRVKAAVNGAMEWFDTHKLTGLRLERQGTYGTDDYNTVLVADSEAGPLWARYYDLEKGEPYVCDRDGIPRKRLEDIGRERRNGYSWYNSYPAELVPIYNEWKTLTSTSKAK